MGPKRSSMVCVKMLFPGVSKKTFPNFAGNSYKNLRDTAISPFVSWSFTSAENFIHYYQKKDPPPD